MTCDNCGGQNDWNKTYCEHCGARVLYSSMTRFCFLKGMRWMFVDIV